MDLHKLKDLRGISWIYMDLRRFLSQLVVCSCLQMFVSVFVSIQSFVQLFLIENHFSIKSKLLYKVTTVHNSFRFQELLRFSDLITLVQYGKLMLYTIIIDSEGQSYFKKDFERLQYLLLKSSFKVCRPFVLSII